MRDIPPFDTKMLTAFLSVVRHGSFSRAADALNLHPGTIATQIRGVEKIIGGALFQRKARPAQLTALGQRFHPTAERILSGVIGLKSELKVFRQGHAGEIRLEASTAMTKHLILPILHKFSEALPDIALRISHTGRFQGAADRGYDVMIRRGTFNDSNLVAQILGSSPFWFVAAPLYLKANPRPIEVVEDLWEHDCILPVDALTRRIHPWPLRMNKLLVSCRQRDD